MDYKIFSVKDTVSGNFAEIQIFNNIEMAKRWFLQLCQKSPISGDLQLFLLGSYNIQTGEINPDLQFLVEGVKHE